VRGCCDPGRAIRLDERKVSEQDHAAIVIQPLGLRRFGKVAERGALMNGPHYPDIRALNCNGVHAPMSGSGRFQSYTLILPAHQD
jgi:hypothetical protein